jgi:SET domain-containing protein
MGDGQSNLRKLVDVVVAVAVSFETTHDHAPPRGQMKRKKLLRHLHDEVYCRIGVSKIHGVGVLAIRHIPKGVRVLESPLPTRDVRISEAQLRTAPAGVRRLVDAFCEHESGGYLLPRSGFNAFSLYQYVNHSKEPNVKLVSPGHYVTRRSIAAGEELTLDYDRAFGEEHVFRRRTAPR